MRTGHTLIVGRTGSGKTAVARALIRRSARAIVLDREHEYDIDGADTAYSFAEAADILLERRHGEFVLVFRPDLEGDYIRMLLLASHVQSTEPHGPLVIVIEEASHYSDTYNVEGIVRELYNAGRRRRITMVSVIQVDTDIHRVSRRNSRIIVSMAQNWLTGEMQSKFDLETVQQLRPLELERQWIPEPVQNVHFAVYPPAIDLYAWWAEMHGYLLEADDE